jgi:hypothetical protein
MAHFLSLQQAVLRWSLEKVEGFNDRRCESSHMGAKVMVDVKKE